MVTALELHYYRPAGWLLIDEGAQFRAYLLDTDGGYEDVTASATWSSSDTAVARATAPGLFTAVGPGAADIGVSHSGLNESLPLVVQSLPPPYPYLRIRALAGTEAGSGSRVEVELRETQGSLRYVDASWWSSNPAIATVDHGVIIGHSPGSVEMTASYQGLSTWIRLSIAPRSR